MPNPSEDGESRAVARWYRPGHRLTPQQLGEFNAVAALRIVGGRLA
jgi:hypothetical protein